MKRSPTVEELKADIDRLQKEIDASNLEQGFCKLPPPVVSDVWAQEAFQKHLPEIKEFLAEYAELLLTSKQVIVIGESEKLKEWRELLDVASYCDDTVLSATCNIYANVFIKTAMNGGSFKKGNKYAELASIIAEELSDYPYHVYEPFTDDYDGNFQEYYVQKQGEIRLWQEN